MKKLKSVILLTLMALFVMAMSTGCMRKPYHAPVFEKIGTDESAYFVSLLGDTSEQQSMFASVDLLEEAKIATKEVEIPHRWVQTGRRSYQGEWRPSAEIIKVSRAPVTRSWTAGTNGTSSSNQGIVAESANSIGFTMNINLTAQIQEADTSKYLYTYGTKPLSSVLDSNVRMDVSSLIVGECAKRDIADVITQKNDIIEAVRVAITEKYEETGITITTFGSEGQITYDDPKIQEAINAEFVAKKDQTAQVVENATRVAKAKADAEAKQIAQETQNATDLAKAEADNAIKIANAEAEAEAIRLQASTLTSQIKLKELEIQLALVKAWDGSYPDTYMGGDSDGITMIQLPVGN